MFATNSDRQTRGASTVAEGPAPADPRRPADEERRPAALLICRAVVRGRAASRQLRDSGLEVATAGDVDEALRVLATDRPSVILVEAGLRQRDGVRVFEQLQRAGEVAGRIPIMVLCANDREVRYALATGVTDIVRKPWDWRLIARRARVLAASFHSMTELETARTALDRALRFAETARRELDRSARVDGLTDLPNRGAFETLLNRALAAPRPADRGVAVMVLDLDRFGAVNEAYGLEAGNQVLVEVGRRLKQTLGRVDTLGESGAGLMTAAVSRLWGDQFALMLTHVPGNGPVTSTARALLEAISMPIDLERERVYLSASIGGAFFPTDGSKANALLQHAERAMLEAKRAGGGVFRWYRESLSQLTGRKLEINRLLHESFARRELYFHYQPLLDVREGRIVAAEALLRWTHPEQGAIRPDEFIPVAEESGLMVAIGAWGLETACRQLQSWLDEGLPSIRMAVNLSHCQLRRSDLVETVRHALDRSGLDPRLLELELSERGMLRRDPEILRQLKDLKRLGVRLSIDDFGTGESAIAYLKELPVDALKIDRSYVSGPSSDGSNATIASAIAAMARELNLTVVAEGVESTDQLELVTAWNCDLYQGFLFARPVDAETFRRLLADGLPDSTGRDPGNAARCGNAREKGESS